MPWSFCVIRLSPLSADKPGRGSASRLKSAIVPSSSLGLLACSTTSAARLTATSTSVAYACSRTVRSLSTLRAIAKQARRTSSVVAVVSIWLTALRTVESSPRLSAWRMLSR